jgi:hypothetical protein
MKKSVLLLMSIVFTIGLFAQPTMYKKADWKAGETKVVSGTTIKKIEGDNLEGSITNISYQTQKQLFVDLKNRKKTGAIGGERYKNEVERYQKFCAGGLVQLYITRPTQVACNPKWFHIEVKDKNGKLLFQKDLKDEESSKIKDGSGYKCSSLAFIKSEAFLPITIELQEDNNGIKTSYIYEISSAK